MAATDDKDGTTADATDKPNEQESSTLISVLTSMKSSIDSGNSLLLERVNRKRSSPDGETESGAKRRKTDTASQKASTLPSDEDEHEASEKANKPHQHDADDADKLSLFGADSDNEEDVDLEDSGNEESDNASLLSEISSSLSCSEDTGPPIADSLAELINGKFNADFSVEKKKEILQKYKKPSNFEKVLVPKINEEIWSKLPSTAKRSVIKMSALQDTLVKVSSAIICPTDKLLQHSEKKTIPNYKALINPLLDSVTLLGHICTELSYKRRDALKSFLHQDFRLACTRSRKPGKLLFGDDLPKTLQELKTTNKIMTSNSSDNKHYKRSNNNFKQQGSNRYQQKPFLVYRGRSSNPPKSSASQGATPFNRKFTKP